MQLLTFNVAGQPYAIESRRVIEVLPLVPARPLPQVPDYLLGIFTYRGSLVPLVDLARRFGVAAASERLSTRVIVVEYPRPVTNEPALQKDDKDEAPAGGLVRLGLVAENVIAVRAAEEAAASLPPLRLPAAEYLDRVYRLGGGTVQLIDISRLLPAELLAGLPSVAAAAGTRS
jgi:chemotaxis-related protein WspB